MELQALTRLGFSEKKARFYLAALELGEAPIARVAKRAGVTRTTAYDLAAALEADGLLTPIEKAGRAQVVAEDPQHMLFRHDQQRRSIASLIPELRALRDHSLTQPRVRYYPGREGVVTILEDVLRCQSGEVKGILSMRELLEVPGDQHMAEHIAKRRSLGIKLRVVRSYNEEVMDIWPTSADNLREVRFTANNDPFLMTSYIYDDKVAYLSSRRENFALLITSSELSALASQMFEILWATSQRDLDVAPPPAPQ